ncbi:MAG: hypothetical protein HOL15_02275 [Nitrospinaceae bacterium]|nr:hypothetical protein [Nitrospinaceae bacterium]MBT5869345.1 hypothetical protein [Nitrospinaceae bacterium]MBT6345914.1 hypothetical protein [Nitrospina sp.]
MDVDNTKPKPDTVTLRWSYSPITYFEGPFRFKENNCCWEFFDGSATATINAKYPVNKSQIKNDLNKRIESIFNASLIYNHTPYKVSEPFMEGYDSKGNLWITPVPINLNLSVSGPNIVIKDSNGNAIEDMKGNRLRDIEEFAKLSIKYSGDPAAQAILRNYKSAVGEPNSEFCHFYAIREVLTTRFWSATKVRSCLNLKKDDWTKLGKLCNEIPVQQGRHQGQKYEQFRKATNVELEEARIIVKTMVKQFFNYLQNSESH